MSRWRARSGIPARIAVGLVYIHGAFYYHAWPEVYLDEGLRAQGSGQGRESGCGCPSIRR